MRFPDMTSLPAGWELRSEQHSRYGGGTYTVWSVYVDGQRKQSSIGRTREHAEQYALKLAEIQAGLGIADEIAGAGPSYDRGQYERACTALDIEPAPDETVWHGTCCDLNLCTGRSAVDSRLRHRRIGGISDERSAAARRALARLADAGFGGSWFSELEGGRRAPYGSWTRTEYERACAAAELPARRDRACVNVYNQFAAAGGNIYLAAAFDEEASPALSQTSPGGSHDALAELAVVMTIRRAYGIMKEIDAMHPPVPCDECGTQIPHGAGMGANLGPACSPECYDAMADRPGRYASKTKRP